MSRARRGTSQRVTQPAQPRTLTDPREMRALAHPVRLALLEALTREGPLTATEAAEIVGESPANCSFHLRTLAKYGFVEEAEGGTGRARPWRRIAGGQSFSVPQDDPVASVAAQALEDLTHERTMRRIREFRSHRDQFPEAWRDRSFSTYFLTYLTVDELQQVSDEMHAILMRYADRLPNHDQRPADAHPVELAIFGTPLTPTATGN